MCFFVIFYQIKGGLLTENETWFSTIKFDSQPNARKAKIQTGIFTIKLINGHRFSNFNTTFSHA